MRVGQALVQTLFRNELIETVAIPNNNATYGLTANGGQLPKEKYMSGIFLQVRFRVTNAGSNNPTAVLADAPYSIISQLVIQGKHRVRRSNDTIIDLSGSDLAELSRNYQGVAPQLSGTLVTTAAAAQDISFILHVPFTPLQCAPSQMVNYLVDCPNYDNLTVSIKFADDKSLFSGQTSASTLTAYGSTSGSPSIRVIGSFAQAPGSYFNGFLPGLLQRYGTDFKTGVLTTSGAAVRLVDIPRGGRIRSALIKTGVLATGTTSGNVAYATLSDSILSNIFFQRGQNRSIAEFADFQLQRAFIQTFRRIAPSTGYALQDWSIAGNPDNESLDLRSAVSGSTGDIDCFIKADVSAASNQQGKVIWEEIVTPPSFFRPPTA